MSRIVDFYRGEARHPQGVSIETIWGWDDHQLEYEHTYIQWLFPLREPSRAVPGSPTITDAEVAEFRRDPELRERVLRSFRVMLGFYGFAIRPVAEPAVGVAITAAGDFDAKSRNWLTRVNHNHLRITRILKSLSILGLKREAVEWFAALQRVCVANAEVIGPTTYEYWRNAVR
ncbi:MAG: opioid growth factor receptor-related protein [Spirochaetes bacterium]|nr:opioid growth factor receptor-related protein [Spirochaetota bacterium]